MKTIVIASRKGGAGKTTNTRHLAVSLSKAGKNVLVIDTDTQGTLTNWIERRNARGIEDFSILTVPYAQIGEAVAAANSAGFEYLLIDTPPDSNEAILNTVILADFILVPCKASPDDLGAIDQTYNLITGLGKQYAFVINEAKPNTGLLTLALELLSQKGPLAPTQYSHISVPTASVTGHTVLDLDPTSKPALAADRLYEYIMNQLGE